MISNWDNNENGHLKTVEYKKLDEETSYPLLIIETIGVVVAFISFVGILVATNTS